MAKKKSRGFFQNLSLSEQVHLARPLAQQLIRDGIMSDPTIDGDIVQLVASLSGHARLDQWNTDGSDVEHDALAEAVAGAAAIGIALGLMLRPEAFELKGGAR